MAAVNQQIVLNKIQEMLKVRRLTYAELSTKMGLSHPAIKRIFSKEQVTFENLIKMCECLEISLSDLFYEVEQENMKVFRFSLEQEEFFALNPHFLSYFYQIRFKRTPAQIQERFRLSERSTSKYLKVLKGMGLIKFEGDTFISTVTAPIFWEDSGPLGRVVSAKMIEELVRRATSDENKLNKPFVDLKNLILSKNQQADFLEEVSSLMEKFQSVSSQNSKLKKKTSVSLTSLFICGERQMNLFENIPSI